MINPEIRFLQNEHVDRAKWDRCVELSSDSSVYARCWFLDIVCPDWAGLVWGDYENIMPLPYHRKYSISYLSQPVYLQQIGIFPAPGEAVLDEMLNWVVSHFKYIRLSLNPANYSNHTGFRIEARKNYLLQLNATKTEIESHYHPKTRRNVRLAKQAVFVMKTLGAAEYLNLKQKFPGVEDVRCQSVLTKLITSTLYQKKGVIYGAYSPANELCGAAFFLFDTKRVYYLNSVSSDTGKKLRAMYAIMDHFIDDHCENNLLLDFEGSQNPAIAHFFERFGTEHEIYQHLYRNKLPWPLRVIKK